MKPIDHIAAVIPAYNAGRTVGPVVGALRELGLDTLVVDDGSSDETARAASSAGAAVLRHRDNLGKGHALVSGFRWALDHGRDYVATLDADGQHLVSDLPRLLERASNAALVVGQRRLDLQSMPRVSFTGNCISTFWISLFCGQQFPDTQCGYRIYSRSLLRRVPLVGGHFETETELLMRAALLGLRVEWVPIQTIYNTATGPHASYFHNVFDSLRVIGVVLRSRSFPRGQP